MTTVSFAGNDLQTANIITSNVDHDKAPESNLKLYEIAHGDRSAIPYRSYPKKVIRLQGTIVGSGIADLDSRLDTFKAYFNGRDKNLDIGYNGGTRRYVATARSPRITRPGGLAFAYFDIEVIATEPFGRDTSTSSLLSVNARTLATYSDSFTFEGSAPIQLPIITIEYTALTGGTAKTVTVSNQNTGQALSVTRTWVVDDILVVDAALTKVTVNGIEVDFTGAFPEFETGSQTLDYLDDLTTRSFDIDVDYYRRYL